MDFRKLQFLGQTSIVTCKSHISQFCIALMERTVVKMDKYCEEFQYIDPLQSYKPWVNKYDVSKKDMIMPANERQIAAVFVCSDPIDWGRDLQVLCDVFRAGGYPGKMDSKSPQPPLFFAADDFEYPTKFPVPRFGMGAFRIILQSLYARLMNRPLSCTSFGKPKPIVYHLAAKSLQNVARMMSSHDGSAPELEDQAKDEKWETLYMIGDNPETDIAGAIGAGRPWFSILVRSGNFRGPGNHDKFPADKVVDDVYAAVDFILKKEGISSK
ncbi:hypothetical protein KC19_5G157400 [Ceratodon purpureus]|uniref:Uncharacterized protein n=1 Tax=Ceratodon purpureus TaxID=3225 RepID=A0A8T0I3D2_CERPU|nr:hypothetical protein KC19_5G157400 [Ceratodon purpureus]